MKIYERCTSREHKIIELRDDIHGYHLTELYLGNGHGQWQAVSFNTQEELKDLRDKLTDFLINLEMQK